MLKKKKNYCQLVITLGAIYFVQGKDVVRGGDGGRTRGTPNDRRSAA